LTLQSSYDYIIAGAGCAGLSLAVRLIQSGNFTDKKILLIDKDVKATNDRTWCFWEAGQGLFEPVVYKSWERLHFYSNTFSKELQLAPYRYKLIRGGDFYRHCLSIIQEQPNVHFLQGEIGSVFNDEAGAAIMVESKKVSATYVFNSIYKKTTLKPKELWMLQHFKGWVIETAIPAFDPSKATLMDFRTGQEEGATFFYVMPFSETKALVEYTLFSPKLLPDAAYKKALQLYIGDQLGVQNYTVTESEFGVIPMTNVSFQRGSGAIRNIGTAGGQTKGSSGYTFQFIQKETAAIVDSLNQNGHPHSAPLFGKRFRFYDEVLLSVLYHKRLQGSTVFTKFFKNNTPQAVFKFLDNETSLPEELRLISSLPTVPFAKAALWKVLG
jgi:lycopene beta-cyclase